MGGLVDEVLSGNERWAAGGPDLPAEKRPARRLAVVTCMDTRVDAPVAFGLEPGEAHVIRNAGAIVTDDVERSVLLSQYALGTTGVLVIGHTDCGLLEHDEQATVRQVEQVRGGRPSFPLGSLPSIEQGVTDGVARLRTSALLRHTDAVHGFVFDVATGRLAPVEA